MNVHQAQDKQRTLTNPLENDYFHGYSKTENVLLRYLLNTGNHYNTTQGRTTFDKFNGQIIDEISRFFQRIEWVSVATKYRKDFRAFSLRTLQNSIRKFERDGWLTCLTNGGYNGANTYYIDTIQVLKVFKRHKVVELAKKAEKARKVLALKMRETLRNAVNSLKKKSENQDPILGLVGDTFSLG